MRLVLKTNGLTKKYGKQIAVNNVNLNIEKGDIYGLIGKNGAGKTTIMKIVCGLIYQSQGDIQLFESSNLERSRKRMGCVIEQPALYPGMTARENLIYYDKLLGITDYGNVDEVLSLVGLQNTGKKKTKAFSIGMKQRLSIAISLLGNPDFLILDEPINGLDPSGIKEVRELLLKLNRENEITILISSHILGELAKIATKYGIIENGVLVDEFAAVELEKRCKKCLSLVVNDSEKAAYIIKNNIKSTDYKVFDKGKICIYDCLDIPEQINKELVENGVLVSILTLEGQDIESYFVKMMGGDK
ncbi:ABC transporter ATP-binding protein [Clostridium saccharobutylicum]|uniref:Bacitracin transport ATP-binding protein BcrA n=1 Tax=Clostridium saccharobutylicum DSM 13864 TaxID=1345695 RepID=U5MLF8_CLOSA|nr:ABC transporter ATP-binding protein [Clostridium saccharobutylicum]AGX41644.1 bacitracin transport ATP-binding protein BcrA [Clostridium saccharobutylicum DSM 13864]AQR88926.1 putative ABC transporter ATP-binding protein YxlF [Clostridium saccharobutylicum]AQR98827.1 putative ABC transporter ATP-binding protein YxlF [Clostridium saccharobutylicum]AQS12815.1 putative ABC transporter ATP-binding protein YxlF [Clostridium saccharobutylicum]MBA2904072.1 ABC-2 type transport system ATP-binding p